MAAPALAAFALLAPGATAHAADTTPPVTTDGGELTVDVGDDLHVDLTGWAVRCTPQRRRTN